MQPAIVEGPTAQAVLDRMVEVYRTAESYGDQGRIRIRGEANGQRLDEQADYLVALERPNKIRVHAYQGIIVSGGEHLWAYATELKNQVYRQEAPAKLTMESLFFDDVLTAAMAQPWTQVYSLAPVQAILLLADDPLKTLLHESRKVERIGSAAIDEAVCYRIEVTRPDGAAVFWIDEKSHLLRRLEFPTVELNKAIAGGRIRDFSVVADFTGARVNESIDPNAFAFQMPEDSELVDSFLTPEVYLLGRESPHFEFVGLDDNRITPDSLAGKVTVLDFWATWCGPCRDSLPELQQVYNELGGDDRLNVVAVSVDAPDVSDDTLRETFADLDVELPIARDPEQYAFRAFYATAIPAMVILDADGEIQDVESGFHPNYAATLTSKLERLLAGEDLYTEQLAEFEARGELALQWLRERVEAEAFWGPLAVNPMPSVEIAERSEPENLRIEQLWTCDSLSQPGNILVVSRTDGADRILVLDNEAAIAELAPDGSVAATHPLAVEAGEAVRFLRTGQSDEGRRWFAASGSGAPTLRLLDGECRPLLEYPPKADQFPHAGIADVQFGDLDNDGTPEMCVGYWGDVGVQGVSLEGQRIWRNRTLAQVLRVAVLGLDKQGRRNVLCTNQTGNLVLISGEGDRLAEVQVAGHPINWIVSSDLDGDGQMELCALSPTEEGHHVALGVDLHGEVLWRHPLPPGMHEFAIEPVVAGKVLPGDEGQWLLAGPDGSIHVVSASGELIDRFHYGAALTGLAAAEIDGRRALLVSTADGVDAWRIEVR